jgi:hypothetical protein
VELPADLLEPRRNDDVETTIRAIRTDVAFLTREKNHAARRGCAYVLIEHLNHLVESPEFLPPLVAEGTVPDGDYWLADDVLTSRGLLPRGERPFDLGASGFFVEFLGRLSPLFAELPPDDVPFYGFPGTTVSVHRLEHTTATITSRHLTESEAMARLAQLVGVPQQSHSAAGHRLFCDPRGYGPRRGAWQDSLEIGSAPDRGPAVAAADELSAALGIRLVVATRERFVDNH